jgi:hypothetical protein
VHSLVDFPSTFSGFSCFLTENQHRYLVCFRIALRMELVQTNFDVSMPAGPSNPFTLLTPIAKPTQLSHQDSVIADGDEHGQSLLDCIGLLGNSTRWVVLSFILPFRYSFQHTERLTMPTVLSEALFMMTPVQRSRSMADLAELLSGTTAGSRACTNAAASFRTRTPSHSPSLHNPGSQV